MAKTDRPAEFPTDWHQERYIEDTEREVAGRMNRVAELQAMNAHPDVIAQAEGELDAARKELKRVAGKGQATAQKRPRSKPE